MPQFLRERYSPTVATIMAVFWLLLYVFVNLYFHSVPRCSGAGSYGRTGFSIWHHRSRRFRCGHHHRRYESNRLYGRGTGDRTGTRWPGDYLSCIGPGFAAFQQARNFQRTLLCLREQADSHFHMILPKENPFTRIFPDCRSSSAPCGSTTWPISVTQPVHYPAQPRGQSAYCQERHSFFAALLKLLIPIIVVIPGIAAFVLYQNGMFQQEMLDAHGAIKPDHAYPVLLNLLPAGLKGMAFAALTAAIVASLAGKANSISTIFTLDIYKQYIAPHASERQLVRVGRYTIYVAMGIGVIIAPQLRVLGSGLPIHPGVQQLHYPGVFAIFILGMF